MDLARETLTRVTDNPGRDGFPVWTPDSRRLVVGSARGAATNLFVHASDSGRVVERLTESPRIQLPYSISPDGTRVLFREDDPKTGLDVNVVSLAGDRRVAPLIQTPFNEQNAEVSPDGRWLAYQTNESGQDEISVRSFSESTERRWQVSSAGGTRPLWSRGGKELFYLGRDGLYSAPVVTGPDFEVGRATRLIPTNYFAQSGFLGRSYDVSADGQRFLMIKEAASAAVPQIVVVQNWLDQLWQRAPRQP